LSVHVLPKVPLLIPGLILTGFAWMHPAKHSPPTFTAQELTREFWAEGVAAGDLNGDGQPDLVAGPFWWEGPDLTTRHAYDSVERKSPMGQAPHRARDPEGKWATVSGFAGAWSGKNAYADCFQLWCHDFNDDGHQDILKVSFPGKEAFWYENPGHAEGEWVRQLAYSKVDNESPTFADLTGDGRPELIFHTRLGAPSKARLGYATPDPANPTRPWSFHPISAAAEWGKYQHGLGVGDVNGDQRPDLLMNHGWWEQPASLEGDPEWDFHPAEFAPQAAQIHVTDVNGDGLHDVITALEAHGHGLAWHEQLPEGTFRRHNIMSGHAEESAGNVVFTQPHAVEVADIDGDGLDDLITGKRVWAHGPDGDIDPAGTPVLYWYRLVRDPEGIHFQPHLIHQASGVGTQFLVADLNGDQRPDVAIANKRGIWVFRQKKH
jgi:hypothetical protein